MQVGMTLPADDPKPLSSCSFVPVSWVFRCVSCVSYDVVVGRAHSGPEDQLIEQSYQGLLSVY